MLDDAYEGGHAIPDIRAARASKRRKTAEALYSNNRLTESELRQQEVFHQQQVTSTLPSGTVVPGAPAWFGPAMAAVMEPVITRLVNISARQENATVVSQSDALQPIRNAAGDISPIFPATYGDLNALTNAQRRELLGFYGRPPNPASTRETRLKQLLGIRSL